MKKIFIWAIVGVLLCSTMACSNGSGNSSGKKPAPLSAVEYDYLVEEYQKNPESLREKGFTKTEIYSDAIKTKHQGQDANFTFIAYAIKRDNNDAPAAIFVQYESDKMVTMLGGAPQRKTETRYFCIPSEKSSESLKKRFTESVEKMNYKDYEVFMSNVANILSKVYL